MKLAARTLFVCSLSLAASCASGGNKPAPGSSGNSGTAGALAGAGGSAAPDAAAGTGGAGAGGSGSPDGAPDLPIEPGITIIQEDQPGFAAVDGKIYPRQGSTSVTGYTGMGFADGDPGLG